MKNIFSPSKFTIDKSGNSTAIYPKQKYFKIDNKVIKKLILFSKGNKNCNVRICLHKNSKQILQNMIVLLNKKNSTKPPIHKHLLKDEVYQVIYGILKIDIYKKKKIFKKMTLEKNNNLIIRLKKNEFHKVYPKNNIVIFHEIRPGPFNKNDSIYL